MEAIGKLSTTVIYDSWKFEREMEVNVRAVVFLQIYQVLETQEREILLHIVVLRLLNTKYSI